MVADTLYPLTLHSPCILQGVVVADTLYPLTLPSPCILQGVVMADTLYSVTRPSWPCVVFDNTWVLC